jgi:hypothetical protein
MLKRDNYNTYKQEEKRSKFREGQVNEQHYNWAHQPGYSMGQKSSESTVLTALSSDPFLYEGTYTKELNMRVTTSFKTKSLFGIKLAFKINSFILFLFL